MNMNEREVFERIATALEELCLLLKPVINEAYGTIKTQSVHVYNG